MCKDIDFGDLEKVNSVEVLLTKVYGATRIGHHTYLLLSPQPLEKDSWVGDNQLMWFAVHAHDIAYANNVYIRNGGRIDVLGKPSIFYKNPMHVIFNRNDAVIEIAHSEKLIYVENTTSTPCPPNFELGQEEEEEEDYPF